MRNLRLLYTHSFLIDFAPNLPFQIIYLNQVLGSFSLAMSIVALETFCSALFDIPTGILSDRLGRKLTMALGSLTMLLGSACYAFAQVSWIFYIGAVLSGLSQCLFSGTNTALLYETLKEQGQEKKYHHYRARMGSLFQLALCSSAFLAIWLSDFGLRVVFMFVIIPQALAFFVCLFLYEPRNYIVKKDKSWVVLKNACLVTWRNPALLRMVAARAINYGASEANFKVMAAFVNTLWPVWAVGLFRGLNHGINFVGFTSTKRLIEKFGEPFIFMFRDLYWLIFDMAAIFLDNVISPILLLSCGFWFGPGEVSSDHLMQKEFTDEERATMGSISSFLSSIVFSVVAMLIGYVSDELSLKMGIAVGVLLSSLSLPINYYTFYYLPKKQSHE